MLTLLLLLYKPTSVSADECPDGSTTLAADDTTGTLTITVPGGSFLANTDYQLYYLQDAGPGPDVWFSWGSPVQAIDSNNDNSVDTLVFKIPFSEIAKNRPFYDNGLNIGVDFRITESGKPVNNYFCSIITSLPAEDANKIFNYLQGLGLVPAAPVVPPAVPVVPAAPATCTPPDFGGDGVDTALGCIPTQPENLVKWILKYAILMGGGIAFLLSVFGGVSIILAGGNPEKINAGKEIIGSALTGLLFIIFSVFLLRFIGLDILQLPGFTNP